MFLKYCIDFHHNIQPRNRGYHFANDNKTQYDINVCFTHSTYLNKLKISNDFSNLHLFLNDKYHSFFFIFFSGELNINNSGGL